MVLRIGVLTIFLGAFFACKSPAKTCEDCAEEQAVSGKSIYAERCESCHGADGKLGNSGAADLTRSNWSDEQIRKILTEGQGAMPPALELVEQPSQMDSVIQYIKTLRKK